MKARKKERTSTRSHGQRGPTKDAQRAVKTIFEWEKQHPDTWILLEVTEEKDGEPVRGKLIGTARDPDDFQKVWRSYRNKGILTMLSYGLPLGLGPAVVASGT